MKRLLISIFCVLLVSAVLFADSKQVRILGIADYHSHALPFYSEGLSDMGGIAKIIGYLKNYSEDENTLVFSSGDTLNYGTPAWSDMFKCAEWPWFNNILDAMAYGNHDSDYGPEVFKEAVCSITYPVLGANVCDKDGNPIFSIDGKDYLIFRRNGLKIGVFSLAGDDFSGLVKANARPVEGAVFTDSAQAARKVVAELKSEGADLIILIGAPDYGRRYCTRKKCRRHRPDSWQPQPPQTKFGKNRRHRYLYDFPVSIRNLCFPGYDQCGRKWQ